jgi:hypothetical protein
MPVERPPDVYDEVSNRFDQQARARLARLALADAAKACGLRAKRRELKMDTRDDDVQKMHAMLASLNAEIDALIERVENAGADVRNEIAEIRTKQDEAHAKLASMRDRGGAAWPDLKVGGETAGTLSRLSR